MNAIQRIVAWEAGKKGERAVFANSYSRGERALLDVEQVVIWVSWGDDQGGAWQEGRYQSFKNLARLHEMVPCPDLNTYEGHRQLQRLEIVEEQENFLGYLEPGEEPEQFLSLALGYLKRRRRDYYDDHGRYSGMDERERKLEALLVKAIKERERHIRAASRADVVVQRTRKQLTAVRENKRRPLRPGVRFRVLQRCAFTCQYCGAKAPDVALQIDHVIPIAKGGTDDESNLTVACQVCNAGKRDHLLNKVD